MFKDAGLKTLRALTSCDGLTSFSLPGVEEFTANAVGSVTKLKYFLCWFGLCGVLVSHGMTGMQLSNRNHKNTLIEIFPCCLRLPTFPCPSFCQIPVASASCVTLTAVTHLADVLQAAGPRREPQECASPAFCRRKSIPSAQHLSSRTRDSGKTNSLLLGY